MKENKIEVTPVKRKSRTSIFTKNENKMRIIKINLKQTRTYASNSIKTARYNM
jgi:hypothetical protein